MQVQIKKPALFNPKLFPMDLARLVCSPLLLWYRMKKLTPDGKKYAERFQGGAILAVNHTSFSDPFLVGVTVWYRRLFFLAAEAVMQGKLRTWLLKGVGAIKIDRNGIDIEAIRNSVDVLKKGHLLAVFPQGGIRGNDRIESIKSGAVLIALQAGVPIIPMHICPKKHKFSRRVTIIGNAIDPKDYIENKFPSTKDIEKVAQVLMEEMNHCMMHQ
jgi:1-acyl-sn-glycerol-3-phosphate acyltransferase